MTCSKGAAHLHDLRGGRVREIAAQRVLDARWLPDGRILAIDDRGTMIWHADGVLVAQRHMPAFRPPHTIAIAAGGTKFVAVGRGARTAPEEVYVTAVEGEREWTLNPHGHDAFAMDRVSVAISGDSAIVAIGYQTDRAARRRDFVVIDLATDELLDRGFARHAEPSSARGTMLLAFDATGDRLIASGHTESLGVIRVGRGDGYQRHDASGAVAVALDDSGNLAAFGFAATPDGARGRLRVDYLSHAPDGAPTVEVIDTLSLDPALPDLVALAFSRDSRSLACLASNGAIEVVPVP